MDVTTPGPAERLALGFGHLVEMDHIGALYAAAVLYELGRLYVAAGEPVPPKIAPYAPGPSDPRSKAVAMITQQRSRIGELENALDYVESQLSRGRTVGHERDLPRLALNAENYIHQLREEDHR